MTKSSSVTGHRKLSEKEKAAFLSLLGDEDPLVFDAVRDRLVEYGADAHRWLEKHLASRDRVVRRHARGIVRELSQAAADHRFLGFCMAHHEDLDLEQGVWLLAQTRYPEINLDAYRALMDSFAADLREKLEGEDGPLSCLAIMNDFLFNELGFEGNETDYYDPDNSYFNRVIDRRTGNPISLSTLYWLMARRVGLPIVGIGMPGHFICRYQSSTDAVFVDAFNRGKILTRADCIAYLRDSGHGFREKHLTPATPVAALLRMCANLLGIYADRGLTEERKRFERYMRALERH